jgi:hypothetical protein
VKASFSISLLLLLFSQILNAQNDNSVTIDVLTKGTYKLWEYTLTETTVSAVKHYTGDRPPMTVYEAALTPEQSERVKQLFARIDVESLKEQYTSSQTEGEGSFMFHFRIGTFRKKVGVYYEYPAELKEICDLLNEMLHEKYRIVFE